MRGDGDGWVVCDGGHRHWGRHGAAGLLLRHGVGRKREVLMQLRADWSHHGGTWGLPGGARDSSETPEQAALREAAEEAGVDPLLVQVVTSYADDHGGWVYVTVIANCDQRLAARPTGGESADVRWVPEPEVRSLSLHPGLASAWPRLFDL